MSSPRNTIVPRQRRDLLKISSLICLLLSSLLRAGERHFAETGSLSALLLYLPQHFYLIWPTILGLVALCKRRPRLALLNLLGLAFCLRFPLGWQLHLAPAPSPAGATVRLVTFNIQRGEGDEPRVEAALHAFHPDIVCLQETGLSRDLAHNAVGHHIARAFPGWNARYAGDVTTLSRFPVASERVYLLAGSRRTLETVLQTPKGPLRLLNTHISTTFAGERAPTSKLDHLALLYETAHPSAQCRLDQLPALRTAIAGGSPRIPLILCGDFNTPPRGHFYDALARDLTDAFAHVGNGLGLSFPSRFPLLRIDYIWTRGARATTAFVGEPGGSDHRPLVADIEVQP